MRFKNKSASAKQFGITFAAFFFLLSIVHFFKHHAHPAIELVLSTSFLLLALLAPQLLQRAANIWLMVGLILHAVMSPLVMGLLYFFIFTPYAILLRLFRREEGLKLATNKSIQSYWETDNLSTQSRETLKNQY